MIVWIDRIRRGTSTLPLMHKIPHLKYMYTYLSPCRNPASLSKRNKPTCSVPKHRSNVPLGRVYCLPRTSTLACSVFLSFDTNSSGFPITTTNHIYAGYDLTSDPLATTEFRKFIFEFSPILATLDFSQNKIIDHPTFLCRH